MLVFVRPLKKKLLIILHGSKAIFFGLPFAIEALGAKSMGSIFNLKTLMISMLTTLTFGASEISAQMSRASAQEQARRLFMRLTGVPPTISQLSNMTSLIEDGNVDQAAFVAMTDLNFYKITLYNMFSAYSNVTGNSDVNLTDYTAMVVGLIYNNERFDQVLYGDILYTANDDTQTYNITVNNAPVPVNRAGDFFPLVRDADGVNDFNQQPPLNKVRPIFRLADSNNAADIRYDNNNHYEDLQRISNWPTRLQRRTQSSIYNYKRTDERVTAEDVAGILTTRQYASEFFIMGTNRRAFRFAAKTFLCRDMEQLHDASAADFRVRQDVDRSPGGDSRAYQLKCRGCHAGMDSFAGAFAYFDYSNERLTYNRNALQNGNNKQFRQDHVYEDGYRLTNNTWVNLWNRGPNEALGWRTPAVGNVASGTGVKSLGAALAATEAFSSCMATKVFERVCFRTPTPTETEELEVLAREFEAGWDEYSSSNAENPYNMKAMFAKVSSMCFGR